MVPFCHCIDFISVFNVVLLDGTVLPMKSVISLTKPRLLEKIMDRLSKPIYNAFKAIRESPDWPGLSDAQKRIVESKDLEVFLSSERGNQRDERQRVNPQRQLKFLQRLAPPLFAAFVALSPILTPPVSYAQAIDVQRGASLFGHACIGCHDAGGNIIQPGATLFLKDLQRNGVDTEEEIYRITYYGKGRMPGFGEMCTPRGQCTFGARLKEDEIKLLANFVKSTADQGWSNIGNNGN
ncbi:hypothetical protein L2E82_34560 [Cichorium intybus]|uniref:Uncharacterized protein n=1 Tax=Cichorium intybus TaxID=13427 RepID=A0ACB9BMC6_CICIN|nr:hypothetical protein L2E82_34560 [Cichorium intybus]